MGSHKSKYHFCYLLQSLNEQFPHSTYIGYTVNPKRRIRQHNREVRILIFNIHIQIRQMELIKRTKRDHGKWLLWSQDFQLTKRLYPLNGLVWMLLNCHVKGNIPLKVPSADRLSLQRWDEGGRVSQRLKLQFKWCYILLGGKWNWAWWSRIITYTL